MRSPEDTSFGRQAWFHTAPGEITFEKYKIGLEDVGFFEAKAAGLQAGAVDKYIFSCYAKVSSRICLVTKMSWDEERDNEIREGSKVRFRKDALYDFGDEHIKAIPGWYNGVFTVAKRMGRYVTLKGYEKFFFEKVLIDHHIRIYFLELAEDAVCEYSLPDGFSETMLRNMKQVLPGGFVLREAVIANEAVGKEVKVIIALPERSSMIPLKLGARIVEGKYSADENVGWRQLANAGGRLWQNGKWVGLSS